jgi:hypothetical protein
VTGIGHGRFGNDAWIAPIEPEADLAMMHLRRPLIEVPSR